MDLVAILLNDVETAREARTELALMEKEHLVSLEDAVVVYKNQVGDVLLDQAVNLTGERAAHGAFWGTFLGAILGIATGAVGVVLAGLAGGTAAGALQGWLSDAGISDEMMKEAGAAIHGGKAILFILGRSNSPDAALERLSSFGGTVVHSNLSEEADASINQALSGKGG